VRGGGKKPWRQKGSGRARHGSTRSPIWTHGGVAFAPKPREYRITLNKKTRRIAMKSALSSKVAEGEMIVVDNVTASEFKTKTMIKMLSAIGANGKKTLVVLPAVDNMVIKSMANIPGVKTAQVNTINVYDILNCNNFVVVRSAAEKMQEVYA
jgi:large subunit ribosomal protein L4